jgi:hypothetical protein
MSSGTLCRSEAGRLVDLIQRMGRQENTSLAFITDSTSADLSGGKTCQGRSLPSEDGLGLYQLLRSHQPEKANLLNTEVSSPVLSVSCAISRYEDSLARFLPTTDNI